MQDPEQAQRRSSKAGGGERQTPAEAPVVESGDFSLSYPKDWSLERKGAITRVTSPDGSQVVSFAPGPVGLPESVRALASLLAGSYEDVRIAERRPASVAGHDAVDVTGTARNSAGALLHFRALVVARPGLPSLGAFAARSGGTVGRQALGILRSLRPVG